MTNENFRNSIGKPSIKNFGKPRPKILRVLGNWLSALSKTSAIGAFTTDDKTMKIVSICLFAAGWVGELLTQLYAVTEEDYDEQINNSNNQNQNNEKTN